MANTTSATPSTTYRVDVAQSQLRWQGTKPTGKHEGTVRLLSGSVDVADGTYRPLSGKITVDMTTIDDNDQKGQLKQMLLEHLKGPDFFDTAVYPTSTLEVVSASESADAQGYYTVTANLTIRDQTHPIVFKAKYLQNLGTGKLTVETAPVKLDRTIWHITFGSTSFFKHLANFIIDDLFTVWATVVMEKE